MGGKNTLDLGTLQCVRNVILRGSVEISREKALRDCARVC